MPEFVKNLDDEFERDLQAGQLKDEGGGMVRLQLSSGYKLPPMRYYYDEWNTEWKCFEKWSFKWAHDIYEKTEKI